jgi:hypothetical protein
MSTAGTFGKKQAPRRMKGGVLIVLGLLLSTSPLAAADADRSRRVKPN